VVHNTSIRAECSSGPPGLQPEDVEVVSADSRAVLPTCHFLCGWLLPIFFPSWQHLSFLICKIVPTSLVVVRIKWANAHSALTIVTYMYSPFRRHFSSEILLKMGKVSHREMILSLSTKSLLISWIYKKLSRQMPWSFQLPCCWVTEWLNEGVCVLIWKPKTRTFLSPVW
jgi:hypothetical protein